ESRWNQALEKLEDIRRQYEDFLKREARATTAEQKARVLALAQDFPRLWNAPSTPAKDRKRMLRLLIRDITVEKQTEARQVILHIRWQGGACEDLPLELPQKMADRIRYPQQIIERVRQLALEHSDQQIAHLLNQDGLHSPKGKTFTVSMVRWIRYRYRIPAPDLKHSHELTVKDVASRFGVSPGVVYYWIEHELIPARRLNRGSPYWITLDEKAEEKLQDWVRNSSKIQKQKEQP
ncbi:recombinase family protein, partial [Acidobacteria bacterium AH-259-G07]|nr:recombinase family protein [Acidobacteria bacterium AH-259-G07]